MSGASADEVYKPTWWLFDDLSFLNVHIAARSGESSLINSNRQPDASDDTMSIVNLNNDSLMEELQYTHTCDLIRNNVVKADCNNRRSPTPSVSKSSRSASRTERYKKKKLWQKYQMPD
ncbi:uncharacterized protein LOC115242711 [Formica exsecta]|uniref:uncharacterized protein LOC115242711 n=1 Tax=Formica exsecta TaxID=72781 RepID=UPI0011447A98|nr:uncharacterized protein LOC115242711 [Formica exsecta]